MDLLASLTFMHRRSILSMRIIVAWQKSHCFKDILQNANGTDRIMHSRDIQLETSPLSHFWIDTYQRETRKKCFFFCIDLI